MTDADASRTRALRWTWIGATLALLVFSAGTLEVDNALTQFMPTSEEAELAAISRELIDSGLSRAMVLSVGGGNAPGPVAAALASALEGHPDIGSVRAGLGDDQLEALHRLYFARLPYFVSDRPEVEVPALLEDAALRARAVALKAQLAGPSSSLYARLAPDDPLALFAALIERFRDTQSALRLEDGQFVSEDGRYAFVFLETRASPFDSESQKRLLEFVRERFEEIDVRNGGGHVLEQSGVNRFAVDTESRMRRDIRFISILSLAGISVLFLLVFRSPRSLLIALFPPLFGIIFATSVGLLALSPLHGLTVGFGVALIGVAIDYPIHVLNHHMLVPDGGDARGTVARLGPSLTLGALTTIASFLGLTLTTFPGIGEMGLFAALGIGAALLATLFGLRLFIPRRLEAPPLQRAAARGLARGVGWLAARPAWLALPVALCVLLIATGLSELRWQDDPAALSALDPALQAEDARVRERVSQFDNGRFVIAIADEIEAAVALNDAVALHLEAAVVAGELDAVRSLHSLLWSEALQQRNLAALRAVPDVAGRIDRAFGAEGFRAGAFEGFAARVQDEAALPPPLHFDALAASPIGAAARSMLVDFGDRYAAITYLRGVHAPEAIARRIAALDGAHYFDQQALMRDLYAGYRSATQRVVVFGTALVFVVLLVRYRRLRLATAAFVPSVLVALTTLSVFALLGIEVDLLGLVSLILVMGMGVDYAIFIVDSAGDATHLGATLASLLFSCVTTLFVFGILALSEQPALRSIGLTTGLGIVLAFVLAPSALLLVTGASGRDMPREGTKQ